LERLSGLHLTADVPAAIALLRSGPERDVGGAAVVGAIPLNIPLPFTVDWLTTFLSSWGADREGTTELSNAFKPPAQACSPALEQGSDRRSKAAFETERGLDDPCSLTAGAAEAISRCSIWRSTASCGGVISSE
jgi:hypothetical protein